MSNFNIVRRFRSWILSNLCSAFFAINRFIYINIERTTRAVIKAIIANYIQNRNTLLKKNKV